MSKIKLYAEKLKSALTSDKEFDSSLNKLLSLMFLFSAFIITLMPYSGGYFLYFFEKPPIYIRPDFLSACCGLILLVPLYARGIIYFNKSAYKIIMFILFWSIFSSVIQIGMHGSTSNLPKYLICSSIVISWLGIKGLAGGAWVLALAAAVLNLIDTSDAMGIWGFFFLVCTALGLILDTQLKPSVLFAAIYEEYRPYLAKAKERVENDYNGQ